MLETGDKPGPDSNSLHQSSNCYVESLCQFADFHQAWFFFAQFDLAQVVGINADAVSQLFLAPAVSGSQLTDALSEPFAECYGHARSIRDCDRSHQCL